ncbi:hypothetical protein [Paenibacillus whitsoniae]|uniref:YtkA-like domain-containing protein n=1 Tax=Paenibacillus whitsoniae TaxID=2496558 RepID=A0A3S0AS54_9BACL|nr:hypothetical protein [Paenibacillus whitsoniae]RTE11372.1 hypothetical protein EJQ19_02005 [Paenibacillus whitsoniae]
MRKKKRMILPAILMLGLLTACGQAKETASTAHAGHGAAATAAPASAQPDGHSGHSGHEAAPQTPAAALQAAITFAAGSPKAGSPAELTVRITDQVGKPVQDFQVNHEKLLHLIVVSHDLTSFQHLHPAYKGGGLFTVPVTFPAGGTYKLFADFIPSGGSSTTLSQQVKVEGAESGHTPLAADSNLVKEVSGKEISLAASGLKVNQETTLTFTIRDAKTKQDITNLQPYLGAVGHVVIISADSEQYLHVHPLDEAAKGPEAKFATMFPKAGIYRIWGQFQHNGEVITVPFTVDVK